MKQEEKNKDFEKRYSTKILELDENLVPVIRDSTSPEARLPELCQKRILKFPECRTALSIMIKEFGALYFPEKKKSFKKRGGCNPA